MKRRIIIAIAVCLAFVSQAQDIILKTNGDEIEAKVTEIGLGEVKYNRFDNPTGPVYTLNKSEIFKITYEDGSQDVFGKSGNAKPANATTAQTDKPFEGNIRAAYSGDFDKLVGFINKNDANSGNKMADAIATRILKKQLSGANEVMASVSGQFEYLTKVKGNRIVQVSTQDGQVTLCDCDKGEVYITFPYAKIGLKYTIAEYKQMSAVMKFDTEILQDSVQEIGGYQCKKAIVSGKMYGMEANHSELWYTDEVILPECFLDIFHYPGLVIVQNTETKGNHIYVLVTEIEEIEVSDDAFNLPADYEFFTAKDNVKFYKKLNNAAKNKKTYTVGSKIPDVFWDF